MSHLMRYIIQLLLWRLLWRLLLLLLLLLLLMLILLESCIDLGLWITKNHETHNKTQKQLSVL